MHTGACSRDDPQPKLSPPMTIGYSVFMLPCSTYLHTTSQQLHSRFAISNSPADLVGYCSFGRPTNAKLPSCSYSSGCGGTPVTVTVTGYRVRKGAGLQSLRTSDGTSVKCSAGMIWSVSMFCTPGRVMDLLPATQRHQAHCRPTSFVTKHLPRTSLICSPAAALAAMFRCDLVCLGAAGLASSWCWCVWGRKDRMTVDLTYRSL